MIDIKLSADGDIDIQTGDLAFADEWEATSRHKADILFACQGDYKASPTTGVNAIEYLNGNEPGTFLREVSIQMQRDGINVKRVEIDNDGQILIDGQYENKSRK